jgi:carboxymethylenebutenolidase
MAELTSHQDVAVSVPDGGSIPASFLRPARTPRRAGVLVIHEAFGLTDDIRRIAARFAGAGYPTLAPDFLAGLGPKPICIARFLRSIGGPSGGPAHRRLAAAQRWLEARPEVGGGPIGLAGFCMGGGFALLYAARANVDVVAPFYAAVPDDRDALDGICPVVASYGGRDRIFGGHAERLTAALTERGVEYDVRSYPEAGHSFMSHHRGVTAAIGSRWPMHTGYVDRAAEDAWDRTLAFFERHLAAA